jgi:hypothetical protein
MSKLPTTGTAPTQLDREIVANEIQRYAADNRAFRIQPHTFARWARAFPLPDLRAYAKANRAVSIQPYTFAGWATATGQA